MRILVTGDREWTDAKTMWDVLRFLPIELCDDGPDGLTLIEGEARGADIMSRIIVDILIGEGAEYSSDPVWVTVEQYPADWDHFGRAAGPIRNAQMLDTGVDYVVGFHGDITQSRGTRDMLRRCAAAGIPGRLWAPNYTEVEEWQTLVA